ncbi:GTP-binding protein [Bremerella sp. JC817]|uniref:sulfate adenylyltransferase subunit 1 n=1 Tax=Bremerella sp. JC817 TaxID=3231756 RepID=UPI00345ACAAA
MITQLQKTNQNASLPNDSTVGILRLLTCGSVDDGKSTLIGRLLLETGAVYEDHLQSLQLETKRHGTTQLQIDPALLVDGLEDERAQGITIDIAYRYLRSPRRKIIIADSPGHEQYTRNMVTAASRSDVALILVDARKGILPQTKRHTIIASLLGIRQFILAVNKMDLVGYKQSVFDELSHEFVNFARTLGDLSTHAIPLSGLCGDNVCHRSTHMPWYGGTTLLEALEATPDTTCRLKDELRFPIQRVVRPDSDFRGVSGTIVSGTIRSGDPIVVLPQRQRTKVRSLVTMDGELKSASAGQPVTVTLEDEIDLSRGDWIVSDEKSFQVSREFEATLVWMSQELLQPGHCYILRCSTKTITAEVTSVKSVIDIEKGSVAPGSSLALNEIGLCHISLHETIVHDLFVESRDTGAFILIDRLSHETVAAGIIQHCTSSTPGLDLSKTDITPRVSPQHAALIARRRDRMRHAPASLLVWGTDQVRNAAITRQLESKLFDAAIHVIVIDDQFIDGVADQTPTESSSESYQRQLKKLQISRLLSDLGIASIVALDVFASQVDSEPLCILGSNRTLILDVNNESAMTDVSKNFSIDQPLKNEPDPVTGVVNSGSRINDAVDVLVTAVEAMARD